MKGVIIKDAFPFNNGMQKDLNLLSINNINIIDPQSGVYSCDVIIQTWSFRAELVDLAVTEIEFIKIKNNLNSFLENKISFFEFEQMETVLKIKIEKNNEFNEFAKLIIDAKDLYYGSMNIQTNIKYVSLLELVKQLNENIVPIQKELWSMSNDEIKEYFVEKWRQEGFLKSD